MLGQALQEAPEWTHVMWIDADIEWQPENVLVLLAEDKDIIGGPYPCKNLPLKPSSAVSPIEGGEETDTLIETYYIATGFMLVKRGVCEAMHDHYYDELKFRYSTQQTKEYKYVDLFSPIIDKSKDDLYLSEDYSFCKRAYDIGFNCYMSKRFELGHAMGSFVFSREKERMILTRYEEKGMVKTLDSSVNI